MADAQLEHVNLTVTNALATADRLCDLFGWKIRWQGNSIHEGYTVHVGSENSYLALYTHKQLSETAGNTYVTRGGLNHIAIVVDNLDATEQKVLDAGYKTTSHADYEPGRRFYFEDEDNIEFEIVSYV